MWSSNEKSYLEIKKDQTLGTEMIQSIIRKMILSIMSHHVFVLGIFVGIVAAQGTLSICGLNCLFIYLFAEEQRSNLYSHSCMLHVA